MKRLILILSLLISNVLLSNELSWVDEQIQAIKPPREGMSKHEILSVRNPFIFLSKNKDDDGEKATPTNQNVAPNSTATIVQATPTKKRSLLLGIILNNSAMINGNWYKVGDSINGYKIAKINRISVMLHNQNKKILLSIKSVSNTLKFQK